MAALSLFYRKIIINRPGKIWMQLTQDIPPLHDLLNSVQLYASDGVPNGFYKCFLKGKHHTPTPFFDSWKLMQNIAALWGNDSPPIAFCAKHGAPRV